MNKEIKYVCNEIISCMVNQYNYLIPKLGNHLLVLKCYYDLKIVYRILILSKSIFEMSFEIVDRILILSKSIFEMGFSIPHLVPEKFRFFKYANEKRMASFTHRD